jgi:hypothetical protein
MLVFVFVCMFVCVCEFHMISMKIDFSVNIINRAVFLMDTHCALYEVETEFCKLNRLIVFVSGPDLLMVYIQAQSCQT